MRARSEAGNNFFPETSNKRFHLSIEMPQRDHWASTSITILFFTVINYVFTFASKVVLKIYFYKVRSKKFFYTAVSRESRPVTGSGIRTLDRPGFCKTLSHLERLALVASE